MPGQYLQGLGDRDQETPGPDVDAINKDRVMGGGDWADAWFDVPAPGSCAAKLSCGSVAAELGL